MRWTTSLVPLIDGQRLPAPPSCSKSLDTLAGEPAALRLLRHPTTLMASPCSSLARLLLHHSASVTTTGLVGSNPAPLAILFLPPLDVGCWSAAYHRRRRRLAAASPTACERLPPLRTRLCSTMLRSPRNFIFLCALTCWVSRSAAATPRLPPRLVPRLPQRSPPPEPQHLFVSPPLWRSLPPCCSCRSRASSSSSSSSSCAAASRRSRHGLAASAKLVLLQQASFSLIVAAALSLLSWLLALASPAPPLGKPEAPPFPTSIVLRPACQTLPFLLPQRASVVFLINDGTDFGRTAGASSTPGAASYSARSRCSERRLFPRSQAALAEPADPSRLLLQVYNNNSGSTAAATTPTTPLYLRVREKLPAWRSCAAPATVLDILEHGYRLQWRHGPPPPFHQGLSLRRQTPEQRRFLDDYVLRMLNCGSWEPATCTQFVCRAFLVPKRNSSDPFRFITDLRPVNRYLKQLACRYESLRRLCTMAEKDDWMFSFDLQDGFHAVAVHPSCRKYLTFQLEGFGYIQLAVLPFGLHSSPAVFTKVMRTFVQTLRAPLAAKTLPQNIISASSLPCPRRLQHRQEACTGMTCGSRGRVGHRRSRCCFAAAVVYGGGGHACHR